MIYIHRLPYYPVPDVKEFGGMAGVACRIQKERHEGRSEVGPETMGLVTDSEI